MSKDSTIKVPEAAKLLQISPQQVRLKCKNGILPGTKIPGGRDWLLDRTELEKFLP